MTVAQNVLPSANRSPQSIDHDVARLPVKSFVWGAGIECSFLPHLNVDQFNWTQHNRFWKDDLRLATAKL